MSHKNHTSSQDLLDTFTRSPAPGRKESTSFIVLVLTIVCAKRKMKRDATQRNGLKFNKYSFVVMLNR